MIRVVPAFDALPGTGAEVAAIVRAWGGGSQSLTGPGATEQVFKAQAAGREVRHLATHGLVARDTYVLAIAGTRGLGVLTPVSSPGLGTASAELRRFAVAAVSLAGPEGLAGVRGGERRRSWPGAIGSGWSGRSCRLVRRI